MTYRVSKTAPKSVIKLLQVAKFSDLLESALTTIARSNRTRIFVAILLLAGTNFIVALKSDTGFELNVTFNAPTFAVAPARQGDGAMARQLLTSKGLSSIIPRQKRNGTKKNKKTT